MSTKKKTMCANAMRTRVGKYELGKTLGEGSFAKVKFAKNVETGECVAIKILDRDQVLRHRMVEQIKREISTMKLIKHPNNCEELPLLRAKTGRLKEDEARSYFHQLINAVDYCHSRGVYHRDLKPENLLIDSQGVLKISDFGLSAFSQQVREDGLLHTACGTPNYVAPEVLKDKGYDYGWKLIKRILDPNPLNRITVPEILQDEWFKKGYKTAQFEQEEDVNLDDVDAVFNDSTEHLVTERKEKPVSMNVFELISRSQSFSLDKLFEKQSGAVKRETRFASQCPPNEILSKIEEAAKPMGFNVHKKNYKMKLKGDKSGRKGQLSVATEVFEVAPCLHMVELRKTGGDTLEFHKFYKSFSSELKDIVWTMGESAEA
ncbi:CBL-interacting serine/threonine-protein kinase 9 [Hibiscus syriacus]|uniref:non-specific serine/threonine protein kinase n=1 Tax=Hibiscus syriacus TaxID=106335 RepID=A0A6A3A1H9_HIBSY|nr:CBL-interacting serine/threonine-protein kinase 9 [Hibiscus syriacus]